MKSFDYGNEMLNTYEKHLRSTFFPKYRKDLEEAGEMSKDQMNVAMYVIESSCRDALLSVKPLLNEKWDFQRVGDFVTGYLARSLGQ